jgi:PAS domain S-box-containing protein
MVPGWVKRWWLYATVPDRQLTLSPDPLCVTTLDGHFLSANPAAVQTLGYSETQLLATDLLDLAHPDDREAVATVFDQLRCDHSVTRLEKRFRCADGSYKWLAWSSTASPEEGLAYHVARDCTRQKSDESALQESNARLTTLLESTTDAHISVSREWLVLGLNHQAAVLLMHRRDELLGHNLRELFPDAVGGPFFSAFEKAMNTGTAIHVEELSKSSRRWLEVHAYPSPDGLNIFFRDVTARRRSEEQIGRALQEKEILLREIHHRVKNNLQVICSMLRLQGIHTKDEALLQVLRECRERVLAMAMLHDQLHRSKDLSNIYLGEYLRNLTASLFCSYAVDSSRIALETAIENLTVAIDLAIPCGLIVQELVSNSVRHAFPNGASGHIWLALHNAPDECIELTVCDDGVGFDASTDGVSRSLGLRLVDLFAQQIDARMEHSSHAGSQYRFVFPDAKSKGE